MKKIRKTVLQVLNTSLESNKLDFAEHTLLRESFSKLAGKSVNRGHLKKALPAGYEMKEGHFGPQCTSPSGNTHYISHNEDMSNFSLEKFDDRNAPSCRGAQDRIAKLEAILNDADKLDRMVKLYAKLEKSFREITEVAKELHSSSEFGSYRNPAYYSLLEIIGVHSNIISDLVYPKK